MAAGQASAPAAIPWRRASPLDQGTHQAHKLADREWLAQQHTILDTLPKKVKRGIGGEEENAGSMRPLVGTQPLIDLGATQVWQAYVEQYDIGRRGIGQIQGMCSL